MEEQKLLDAISTELSVFKNICDMKDGPNCFRLQGKSNEAIKADKKVLNL